MEHPEQPELQVEPQPFGRWEFFLQLLQGIGIAAGLALLWMMETVRNAYFRMLDRFNVKPRKRRASAFPPGKPARQRSNAAPGE